MNKPLYILSAKEGCFQGELPFKTDLPQKIHLILLLNSTQLNGWRECDIKQKHKFTQQQQKLTLKLLTYHEKGLSHDLKKKNYLSCRMNEMHSLLVEAD